MELPSKVAALLPFLFQLKQSEDVSAAAASLASHSGALHRRVVIFEVAGGSDKGPDGHRKDTLPIAAALRARGWDAEVLFYTDAQRAALTERVAATADAFLMRVNPGQYPGFTESEFLAMGRDLHAAGCHALQHPDVMLSYGAKDSLVALRATGVGLSDTAAYYDHDQLLESFPRHLAKFDRVLKQNRGSAGEGIWVVKPDGWERTPCLETVPLDAPLLCTEMVDNVTHPFTLGAFMERCREYVEGEGGQIVDQRFLPRIVEGEVRVLMIYDRPVVVVHKKPAEGQLSATLFSGARYTYDDASDPQWAPLVARWLGALPGVRELLGGHDYPLIWTADFILDTAEDGSDAYRLGELNASCVGFTTHLELAGTIADAVISVVTAAATKRAAAEAAALPGAPSEAPTGVRPQAAFALA